MHCALKMYWWTAFLLGNSQTIHLSFDKLM
uniref:Uncharacterized protein n=1 Tax=Anguilla anguilla TaxID=7936 RepID=A0A0E9QFB8_ANGAN